MIKENRVVIVLGAAGFVGRHTALAFANKGYEVRGLGHGAWGEEERRSWGITKWLNAGISVDSLNCIADSSIPSCVVHCGGSGTVSYSYSHPLQDFDRATRSTAQVLEWMRLRAIEACRFVLVSSAAVYGDVGDSDANEASNRTPISPYGIHKMAAENLCESYSKFFGVSSSIVRLFSVYGEGLQKQLLWDALNKFKIDQPQFFGTGNERRDWLHVEDAAELLVLAGLTKQVSFEIYNGGFDQATIRELLNRLALHNGYKKEIVFNGIEHKGSPKRLTSNSNHAKKMLKWEPKIILQDGLARYENWYRKFSVNDIGAEFK